MDNNQNSNISRIIALVVILIIGGGALAYTFLVKKAAAPTTVPETDTSVTASSSDAATVATTPASSTAVSASASLYKDGTYSATGSYLSPGGNESIGVTVTLKDDVITAASVKPEPVSSEGQHFQGIFQQNFQPLVIGKNISDVHLSEVSGSSLTSGGFQQALTKIEAEAKA